MILLSDAGIPFNWLAQAMAMLIYAGNPFNWLAKA
jgi:hypothetical protein